MLKTYNIYRAPTLLMEEKKHSIKLGKHRRQGSAVAHKPHLLRTLSSKSTVRVLRTLKKRWDLLTQGYICVDETQRATPNLLSLESGAGGASRSAREKNGSRSSRLGLSGIRV